MVISIHPSPSQPLVDSAIESFSYRWLVTMAALGVEPPPSPPANDINGDDVGRRSGYFIDVDPKAAPRGGRDSVDGDLEFEFLVPPSRCSPTPADKIISDGLLLSHKGTQDRKEKDKKGEVLTSSTDESRELTRSLSADSWSSTGTMFSSCPSRSSSASSSSASSVTPLKSKSKRLAPPALPPPVSTGQSPLLPRLPRRREEAKKRPAAKKGIISLASIPQKIARLCLCLLAAACRRAAEAVSTANSGSGSSGPLSSRRDSKAASSALPRRDSSKKKKGRKGVEGLSSAIQWCRTDADAVENSIHEAVLHCKRSYAKTD